MSLSLNEVKEVARLARLAVTDVEAEVYARELSSILALIEQLQAVDIDNVEPLAHPLDMAQRLRTDVVNEQDQHELYQRNAPQTEADLYLVPKVIG